MLFVKNFLNKLKIMEEKKKNKSGYAILKSKLAKKDIEIAELKEELAKKTQQLINEHNKLVDWYNKAKALDKSLSEAIDHMGWLRRKIFKY